MFGKVKKYFGRYNKQPVANSQHFRHGLRGRDSFIDPNERERRNVARLIQPDEKSGIFRLKQLSVKQVLNQTPSQSLQNLIEISPSVSQAVRFLVDHIARDYQIVTGDDDDDTEGKEIIDAFIERTERGREDFLTGLKRSAYSCVVEGGDASETSFDEQGIQVEKIDIISPWSLSYEKVQPGDYYRIGQRNKRNQLDPVLQDEKNPNDLFIYTPTNVKGLNPYGSSYIAPAIFSVTSIMEVLRMVIDFTHGQVFPKGVWAIDPSDFESITPEQAIALANDAAMKLESAAEGADLTQDLVLASKLIYILIGAMDKANISGVEMIIELLERDAKRALGMPNFIFGGHRRGNTLNDNDSKYELIEVYERIVSLRRVIERTRTRHFTTIIRHEGSLSEARLKLDDNDVLLKQILAEISKEQMEVIVMAMTNNLATQAESRRRMSEEVPLFRELSPDLPEELANSQPQPQPGEPADE